MKRRGYFCPNCGKDLGLDWPAPKYGSPFRNCRKCKAEYVDKNYIELAIVKGGVEGQLHHAASIVCLILTGLFLFGGLYTSRFEYINGIRVTDSYPVFYYVVAAIFLLCALWNYIYVKSGLKRKKLDKLYGESVMRLRDINYARKLQANGFEVPAYFLKQF